MTEAAVILIQHGLLHSFPTSLASDSLLHNDHVSYDTLLFTPCVAYAYDLTAVGLVHVDVLDYSDS